MERIYKNTTILKHEYAFTEFGQVVSISQAEKNVNGVNVKYYLFDDLTYELILKDGQVKQKHFAIKTQYLEHNGKKYAIDHNSESPQHYDAKLRIIKDGCFSWSDYLIKIKNPRLERRFSNSYFRADLMAELESGEAIFIEVIKTSNTSKSKEKFIVENKLPTFKIWIDDEGNFINERFDFIGNEQIEQLRRKYQERSIELRISVERRKDAWKHHHREKERVAEEIYELEERLRSKIESEEHRLPRFYDEAGNEVLEVMSRIESVRKKIRNSIDNSKTIRESIYYYNQANIDAKRMEQEIKGMENLFIQASKAVKWEWVEPRNTREPQGKDRLQQLKYFLT